VGSLRYFIKTNETHIQHLVQQVIDLQLVPADDLPLTYWEGQAQVPAWVELVRIGAPAIPYLLPHLDDAAVCGVLREFGDLAVEPLLRTLDTAPDDQKSDLLVILGWLESSDPRINETLLRLADHSDPLIQDVALAGLATRHHPQAYNRWVDKLNHQPEFSTLLFAIQSLSVLRDPRAVDHLLPLLDRDDVRHVVVLALGSLGSPRAAAALRRAAERETDPAILDNINWALAQLNKDA